MRPSGADACVRVLLLPRSNAGQRYVSKKFTVRNAPCPSATFFISTTCGRTVKLMGSSADGRIFAENCANNMRKECAACRTKAAAGTKVYTAVNYGGYTRYLEVCVRAGRAGL